ncbi:MAG: hypothetical protein K8I60_10415, partial [Anaerolineae bacterium]|nr:hypothetical protein [Anaerolineae bacterium]
MSKHLSRREFLQVSGIVFLGSRFIHLAGLPFTSDMPYPARALMPAAVYQRPDRDSVVIRTLWPDSVNPILESRAGWYRLADGWVQQAMLQPMPGYQPAESKVSGGEMPFWAEVSAPVAAVRAWCAADAPLVARIGHGGMARVMDALPDQQPGGMWYGLAGESGELLGWTPGNRWRAVTVPEAVAHPHITELTVDRRSFTLTAWEDSQAVLQTQVALSPAAQSGSYTLRGRQPNINSSVAETGERLVGIPWALDLGEGGLLAGAY